ncbi:hypothetical protein B0H10DRAFT_2207038 [Mycena sp. CBHHK59/15]|nr:hypothetical protein B0H10DRAFT_2207038 [Mycena sp. CBHHK59/15]
MAVPGTFLWGDQTVDPYDNHTTYHDDDDTCVANFFPSDSNALGIFSTDPKYAGFSGPTRDSRRRLQPTPPTRLEIQGYQIEGGWTYDASGGTYYVSHGGIKEVGEDDGELANETQPLDPLAEDSQTFFDEEPLPPDTTPPPRPIHRPIELLPLHVPERLPLHDGSNTLSSQPPPLTSREFRSLPGCSGVVLSPSLAVGSPPVLTLSQELNLVEQNLLSLATGSLDVASLHNSFAALPFPLDAHLTLCDAIGEALHAVHQSLKRRSGIAAEEWRLRSDSCKRKTLERLRRLANSPPLRVNQFDRVLELLNQHHAKLSDLAGKFNATFDRLRIRHLHKLLTDACAEAQRRRPFPQTDTLDGILKKEERKTARSARLRRYDYALHREGRRPSLVETQ